MSGSVRKAFAALLLVTFGMFGFVACSSQTGGDQQQTNQKEQQTDGEMKGKQSIVQDVTLGVQHFADFSSMWSLSHHESLQRLVDRFEWLDMESAESVPPENINGMARDMIDNQNVDIMIQDTEFIGIPVEDIYQDYPDVHFASVFVSEPYRNGRNWIRPNVKSYQARYLSGLIMGELTETDRIGLLVSFDSADPRARVNAITLGIREVNPDAEVFIGEFIGGWYDPPTEKEISNMLIEDFGVDVLHNPASDSLAPVETASEHGIWFVGKDADLVGKDFADKETVAISYKNNWESMYYELIMNYVAGMDNPPRLIYPGYTQPYIKQDGSPLYPNDIVNDGEWGADAISPSAKEEMDQEVIDLVKQRRQQMIQGAYDPFLKKLVNTKTGEVEKPAGVMPDSEDILTMEYWVEGVQLP